MVKNNGNNNVFNINQSKVIIAMIIAFVVIFAIAFAPEIISEFRDIHNENEDSTISVTTTESSISEESSHNESFLNTIFEETVQTDVTTTFAKPTTSTHNTTKTTFTTTTKNTTTSCTTTSRATTTDVIFKKEYLANMELFADGSDGFNKNEYLVNNYRNEYTSSISVDSGYISYLIKDMGYTHFCGTIALPKGISTDGYKSSAQLEIYVDDVLALRSENFTNESKPQEFDIDVTDAEVIKLSWSCSGANIWSNWCYYATVFDGKVTK